MRILLTADAELPVPPKLYGGIERIIASLVKEYRQLGHVVGLVAHRDSSIASEFFLPWPGLSSTGWHDTVRNAVTLCKAVRRFKPDVIHSFSRLLLLWPLAVTAPRVPIVMSYQREPSGDTVRWSRRVIGDHRLRFTGCSGYIAENGRQRGSGSWIAVPNFVDIENFTFVAQVPDDAPLVYLSRLERAKGAHSAIAIAKGAGRRLVIAGNRVNSDEGRHYWKHEIEHEIGRNGIEYIGPVDDVQKNQLLGSASAMVVPIEWNEPFGIVFAESLACGTPVISSPRGAVPSIVLHDTHGYLVRSIEEGIDGVRRLHTISRAACRQQAEASFNVVSVAQDYLNLYQTAMLS